MKRLICAAFAILTLSACAKPVEMINRETGQIITCKGSTAAAIFGGAIGHRISRNDCLAKMREAGFARHSAVLEKHHKIMKEARPKNRANPDNGARP